MRLKSNDATSYIVLLLNTTITASMVSFNLKQVLNYLAIERMPGKNCNAQSLSYQENKHSEIRK
jgi:hypothetical protein